MPGLRVRGLWSVRSDLVVRVWDVRRGTDEVSHQRKAHSDLLVCGFVDTRTAEKRIIIEVHLRVHSIAMYWFCQYPHSEYAHH